MESIFDKDPQLAKLPAEQRTQLKQSLKTVDADCVGMPTVALECFKKADSLQALSACGQVVAPSWPRQPEATISRSLPRAVSSGRIRDGPRNS